MFSWTLQSDSNIEYYDHQEFQEATTKEEVCKVGRRTAVLYQEDEEISEEAKIRKVSQPDTQYKTQESRFHSISN